MNKEETIKDIENIINANCWTISEHFAKNVATALYNAGYRKVDNIGDFTVYGFKNGYVKALIEKDKEIKRLKADNEALQKNTAEAIGGLYSGHFYAQEQFAIYVMRELEKIFAPFISKDNNDTENPK